MKKRKKRIKFNGSKVIAFGVMTIDAIATFKVLELCRLAILNGFEGALPYLTTLIGALNAATAYVLGHYFKKSTKENKKGGIVYDTVMAGLTATENDESEAVG